MQSNIFQLETNESLLIPKSRAALSRYGHQIVVGNVLNTRKKRVLFVTNDSVENIVLDTLIETVVNLFYSFSINSN